MQKKYCKKISKFPVSGRRLPFVEKLASNIIMCVVLYMMAAFVTHTLVRYDGRKNEKINVPAENRLLSSLSPDCHLKTIKWVTIEHVSTGDVFPV